MAFNTSYSAGKRAVVNPKNLRFTQPDIKSIFSDPTYPSVRESVSLIRRGQLSPDVFGDLHVSIDKEGSMWCDNNRRLFVLREAGVHSVAVVFDGNRRPPNSLKSKLSDPAFMPRIRGEASSVQIPPPPTSGRNAYQMQKETSLPGSVSAGYRKSHIYNNHQDHEVDSEHSYWSEEESDLKGKNANEDEDELEIRFKQLDIKFTFSNRAHPIHKESVSLKQWGELNPDVFGDPTVQRDKNALGNKWNDPAYMPMVNAGASRVQIPPPPTSGQNAYQKGKETSLPGFSADYSKRQLYNSHQYHEVYYKYSYKEDGTLKNPYEDEDEDYEDEDEIWYCHSPYEYI